jgi:hypothetical protein
MADAGKAASGAASGAAMGTAIMPGWGTAIGGVAGGVAGLLASSGDQDAAKQAQLAALAAYQGVNVPTIDSMGVHLQDYTNAGQLANAKESALTQDPSKLAGVSVDPRLRLAQMSALSQMQGLSNTGLNATDQAALIDSRNSVASADHGRQAAIMQNMQARGMGGAGSELAQRLMSAQAATNQQATDSNNIAAQAQARALQAMSQAGSMSTGMANTDFSQKAQVASAQDAINNFNTQNQQAVAARNIGSQNQANLYNVQNAQDVANKNTGVANEGEMHNKGLYQTQFQDQMDKSKGLAGQYGDVSKYDANSAQATRDMYSGVGNAVGQAATAYGTNKANNALNTTTPADPTKKDPNNFVGRVQP